MHGTYRILDRLVEATLWLGLSAGLLCLGRVLEVQLPSEALMWNAATLTLPWLALAGLGVGAGTLFGRPIKGLCMVLGLGLVAAVLLFLTRT